MLFRSIHDTSRAEEASFLRMALGVVCLAAWPAWSREGEARTGCRARPDERNDTTDEVSHRLWILVTQQASCMVLQPSACKAVGGPAAIEVSEPVEELDP